MKVKNMGNGRVVHLAEGVVDVKAGGSVEVSAADAKVLCKLPDWELVKEGAAAASTKGTK